MGNRMTVARPYIIDHYPSDDDDEDEDDDDYFSYETAYDTEGVDQNVEEGAGDQEWKVKTGDNNGDARDGQQVTVNSRVVSSLVKEVETLLNFLDKEDYEGAQKAARILKEAGGGEGERERKVRRGDDSDESEPLLSKEEKLSSVYSDSKLRCDKDGISRNGFEEEMEPLLSTDKETDTSKSEDAWTSAQLRALRRLDRELNSFEEHESCVASDSAEETCLEIKPRRKRKSSLPRLKRSTLQTGNDSDGGKRSGSGTRDSGAVRNRSHSRESPINRKSSSGRMPRSPASGIPRFCYKAPTTTKSASCTVSPGAATTASSQGVVKGGSFVSASSGGAGKKRVDEAITSCVQGFTSQVQNIPNTNENFRGNPIQYNIHPSSSDDSNDVRAADGKSEAWEIHISEMTGRAKRNKKRSGIPSLWTENKTQAPSSLSASVSSSNTADSLNLSQSVETVKRVTVDSASQTTAIDGIITDNVIETSSSSNTVQWDLSRRKVFDQKRWNCISRPQYKTSCGISSVVSCWNFLFSTLGHGHLHPLTQEEAMVILGFVSPFDDIKFGPTTGNLTLMRWFRKLNAHFKVYGNCFFMYKPCGRNRTSGVKPAMALEKLKSGLRDKHTTFIYHCHNHYFCPVGFEESAVYAMEAYSENLPEESVEKSWVLIGDTSRKYGPFHCKSWDEICLDLNCESPEFYNIRQSWNGVMKRKKTKKTGGNLHCILCFQSTQISLDNRNQHNKCNPLSRSYHLHPPPPPSSLNSSEDGDFGSSDCNEKALNDDSSYPFDCGVSEFDMEEELEIESVSSEDLDDDSSNFDADSLS